jgi:antitoxin VapB
MLEYPVVAVGIFSETMRMPLYVRDEGVNRLAGDVQKAIGATTKTEAVRIALERLLQEREKKIPFRERLKLLQERTRALGKDRSDFDEKAFLDEMWGDT